MNQYLKHYINGQWTDSVGGRLHTVLNPATEQPVSAVMLGTAADVDLAVKAARAAFESFSQTTKEERMALLGRVIEGYKARIGDIAKAISEEMGAPISLAQTAQAGSGMGHLGATLEALKNFDLEQLIGDNCQVQIVHSTSDDGRTWANVKAIVPLSKGMSRLEIPADFTRKTDRMDVDLPPEHAPF